MLAVEDDERLLLELFYTNTEVLIDVSWTNIELAK